MMSSAESPTLDESMELSMLDKEKGPVKPRSTNAVKQEEQQTEVATTSEEEAADGDDAAGEYATGSELYLLPFGLCIWILLVGLVLISFKPVCRYLR
jgi:hypothetical protein